MKKSGLKIIGFRVMALIGMLLGAGVMAYAGAQLAETQQIYQEGNMAYENLRNLIKGDEGIYVPGIQEGLTSGASSNASATDASASSLPTFGNTPSNADYPQDGAEYLKASMEDNADNEDTRVYVPKLNINFEKLKVVNRDTAAWLYSPDTVIDYPLMRADDYNYYLNHLPDGTRNANGSLFIDYNSASDFSGQLTVIYGHNMKSGSMFGGLKGYKSQSYFEKNPYMYLYTENSNYRIDLLYGALIDAGKWREQAFMFEENAKSLLSYAAQNTTFTSSVEYREGDKIVVLSTCSYEFDDARYVVIGILRNG
ncbi:MAG: class B sortase [Synergistaceae bacterium]|nr:class B sortase [Synergistaceae bacterium]